EPTTGLDPIMADVINDLIHSTVRDLGVTAVSITHDMASARKISNRIAMIYKGNIIWDGATKDIDHSGNAFVGQFIRGSAEGPIKRGVRGGWRVDSSFLSASLAAQRTRNGRVSAAIAAPGPR